MYNARGFREWEIGDIDLIRVGDYYHLFHLVLPNHDYIAHAVSSDCMNWKRTKNALFTGDPGEWDDDMLWTMHVTRNEELQLYEMFYTGLQQRENGNVQRIGRAVSTDLLHWQKENWLNLPLAPDGNFYEKLEGSKRRWVSFRDPYLYRHNGEEWLLVCARTTTGEINRRGCVGLVKKEDNRYIEKPPLFFPRVYDDVECPCIFELNNRYYLIGSIREDVKVHYWFSDSFRGQYRAYRNNVLMPPGNYAARITHDNGHILLYSFYVEGHDVERSNRAFPPPKQLIQNSEGELKLTSYWRWKEMEGNRSSLSDLPFRTELNNPTSEAVYINEALILKSVSGYEIFSFLNAYSHFSWEGKLQIVHRGKCGLVFNLDDGLNGYFISLDAIRGIAQIRGWGARPDRIFKDYTYHHLQDNEFSTNSDMLYAFKLIRWGSYIELSLNGIVVLSLINSHFNGSRIGFYTESVGLKITESVLYEINEPSSETL